MKNPPFPPWLARIFSRTGQTPAQLLETAEREGPESQNNLGIIYMASPRHDQSDNSAAACFHAAAKRGYAPAQYNLALLYERGHGVPRSVQEARIWFLRAAEQGDPAAQFHLALQSHRKSLEPENGEAPESRIEALKWLLLAAEQGYHGADTLCGVLILQMTREQITDSGRRASAFKSFFA